MIRKTWKTIFIMVLSAVSLAAGLLTDASALERSAFTIGRVKYQGGGDWYNDPEVVPNMLSEFEKRTKVPCAKKEIVVSPDQPRIFETTFLYLTGHGNVKFSDSDIDNLRKFMFNGGFLYVDDDYGLDASFRREAKRLFPEYELAEVPFDHPIFHCFYDFEKGAPKIHEHDGGPPRTYAIFHENRIVLLYTFNTNISDGWADPKTHEDPPSVREEAFKMGVNILYYSLAGDRSGTAEKEGGDAK